MVSPGGPLRRPGGSRRSPRSRRRHSGGDGVAQPQAAGAPEPATPAIPPPDPGMSGFVGQFKNPVAVLPLAPALAERVVTPASTLGDPPAPARFWLVASPPPRPPPSESSRVLADATEVLPPLLPLMAPPPMPGVPAPPPARALPVLPLAPGRPCGPWEFQVMRLAGLAQCATAPMVTLDNVLPEVTQADYSCGALAAAAIRVNLFMHMLPSVAGSFPARSPAMAVNYHHMCSDNWQRIREFWDEGRQLAHDRQPRGLRHAEKKRTPGPQPGGPLRVARGLNP